MKAKKIAKAAFEKYAKGGVVGDEDFLSEDGPDFDSDRYVATTGLEDDGRMDIEGEGDKRKAMLLKAIQRMRSR